MADHGTAPAFVEAFRQAAAALKAYEMEMQAGGAYTFFQHMQYLPEVFGEVRDGVKSIADKAQGNWPLHPAIVQLIVDISSVQGRVAEASTELRPAIKRLHQFEIDQHEQSMPGQVAWNVPGDGRG